MWFEILSSLFLLFVMFCCKVSSMKVEEKSEKKGEKKIKKRETVIPVPVEIPSWMEPLTGNSPLLTLKQQEFYSQAHSAIKNWKGDASYEISDDEVIKVQKTTAKLIYEFNQLVEKLRKNPSSMNDFIKTYPNWKNFRHDNIQYLKKIASAIDEDKKNCAKAKIVGNTISLIGGGLCLVTGGASGLVTGSIMSGIGTLTTAGTSAIEALLLRENVNAANKTLQEDREHLKNLWTWVKESKSLLQSLDNIWSMDIDKNWRKAANCLHEISKDEKKAKNVQKYSIEILEKLKCPPQLREQFANVIGVLMATSELFERYPHAFKIILVCSRCLPRLIIIVDILRTAIGLVSVSNTIQNPGLSKDQKILVSAGMILDVAEIILSTVSLNSKSPEAENFRKAAKALNEEADVFESLYNETKNYNEVR